MANFSLPPGSSYRSCPDSSQALDPSARLALDARQPAGVVIVTFRGRTDPGVTSYKLTINFKTPTSFRRQGVSCPGSCARCIICLLCFVALPSKSVCRVPLMQVWQPPSCTARSRRGGGPVRGRGPRLKVDPEKSPRFLVFVAKPPNCCSILGLSVGSRLHMAPRQATSQICLNSERLVAQAR